MIPVFSYFSIYISFCLFFTSHGFLFKGSVFRRLSKADDKLPRSRPLAEYTDISPRRCGLKCFNHHRCSSFFINKEKKVCKLAEEVDVNKMMHSPGYLYYVSEGKISKETSCNVLIVFRFFPTKITFFWFSLYILLGSLSLIIYAQNN